MSKIFQVIHLGYEERSIAGVDLVRRMGAVRVLPRVEDLSIVIQSPSTIIESTSQALANRLSSINFELFLIRRPEINQT